MTPQQKSQEIINKLEDLAIFNMSLSSKELFHSNMLYWLWKVDNKAFLKMLDELLGCKDGENSFAERLEKNEKLEVRRENKNFDLSIYQGKQLIFVLENKVKSIPTKAQLDVYDKKIKNDNCKRLLLTLVENFLDKAAIEKEKKWPIINYKTLAAAINNHYENVKTVETVKQYVNDYVTFIQHLQELVTIWNEAYENGDVSIVVSKNDHHKEALQIRIDDLYGKLYFSRVATELNSQLTKNRLLGKNVVIATNYTRDQPLVEVRIAGVMKDTTFIIQIQGSHYRHGIERVGCGYKELAEDILNKHPNVCGMWWPEGYQSKSNDGDCNHFSPSFIYRYLTLTVQDTINGVIGKIVKDVKVCNKLKRMQKK